MSYRVESASDVHVALYRFRCSPLVNIGSIAIYFVSLFIDFIDVFLEYNTGLYSGLCQRFQMATLLSVIHSYIYSVFIGTNAATMKINAT